MQIAAQARPLTDCESIDDLWRGRLHVELHLLESRAMLRDHTRWREPKAPRPSPTLAMT